MKKDEGEGLPNCLIIGAAKAGTTALADYLSQHPDIFVPGEKETNFFYNEQEFNKGSQWYVDTFYSNGLTRKVRVDASPGYLYQGINVVNRIRSVYGSEPPKFIVLLRDPVKRAWSHYQHMCRIGEEHETFKRALELEEKRLHENPDLWVGYFRDGLYASQLDSWLLHFPKDHFLFLLSDELNKNHLGVLGQICRFLEVDESKFHPERITSNPASTIRSRKLFKLVMGDGLVRKIGSMLIQSDRTKKRVVRAIRRLNSKPVTDSETPEALGLSLRERYLKDISRLEKLTGLDLARWKAD